MWQTKRSKEQCEALALVLSEAFETHKQITKAGATDRQAIIEYALNNNWNVVRTKLLIGQGRIPPRVVQTIISQMTLLE